MIVLILKYSQFINRNRKIAINNNHIVVDMSKKEALKQKKIRKSVENEEGQQEDRPEKQVSQDGQEYWSLTKSKRLSVGKFKGSVNINLREYFEKDGKWLPTKKGITLSVESWQLLKSLVEDIDNAIQQKQK